MRKEIDEAMPALNDLMYFFFLVVVCLPFTEQSVPPNTLPKHTHTHTAHTHAETHF